MNKLYLKNKLIKILSTRLLLVGVLLSLLIPQNAKSQARVYVNGGLEFGVPNAGLSQMDTNFGWAANGNFDAGAAISNPWYTSHPTQASVCSAGGSGACHPVEVWGTNFNGGQGATPSAQGTNFVELNAYVSSMIYQNLYLVTGDVITYYYRHRARSSTTERAGMVIEDQNENVIAIVHQTTLPSSSSAWSINQGTYTYTGPTGVYRVGFRALNTSNPGAGNFLDDVRISMNPIIDLKGSNLTTSCEGGSNGSIFLRVNGRVNDPTSVAFELINPANGTAFVTDADLTLTAVANTNGTPVITHTAGTNIYVVTIPIGNYDGATIPGTALPTNDEDGIRINISSNNDGIAEPLETFKFEIKAQNTNGATNNFVSTSSPVLGDPYVGSTNVGFINANSNIDTDGDGIDNLCDLDDDNDGILDTAEIVCQTLSFNTAVTGTSKLVGSGSMANVAIGDVYVWPNGVIGSTKNYDVVMEITGRPTGGSAISVVSGIPRLEVSAAANETNRYVTFKVRLVEVGSATAANPTGKIAQFEKMLLGMFDLDSDPAKNFTDVGGIINSAVVSNTIVGSRLEQNGFTSGGPTGFIPYRLDPSIVSWTNSGNAAETDPVFAVQYEIPNFTETEFVFGFTGSSNAPLLRGVVLNFNTTQNICQLIDTDGDGIPDYLDLDSDNDGCPDAKEGDENVTNAQLVTAVGTLQGGNGVNPTTPPTSGTYNLAVVKNLGNTVDAQGVPTLVNTGGAADVGGDQGQGVGASANAAISIACDPCNPANPDYVDSDGDGVGDACDLDDDNDGILDTEEGFICTGGQDVNMTNGLAVGTVPMDHFLQTLGIRIRHVGIPALNYTSNNFSVINHLSWAQYGDADNKMIFKSGGNGTSFAYYATDGVTKRTTTEFSIWSDPITGNPPGTVRVVAKDINGNILVDRLDVDGTHHIVNTSMTGGIAIHELIFANSTSAVDLVSLIGSCVSRDTDGDGIPDHLDLDSDNDGCPDAREGDENVTNAQLVTAAGILQGGNGVNPATPPTSGNYNLAVLQNLGNTVDAQGVPTVVNTGGAADIGSDQGQGIGDSQNALIATACDPCNPLNPDVIDSDGDGIGNICDLDDDNDGILDTVECPLTNNTVVNGNFSSGLTGWTAQSGWIVTGGAAYIETNNANRTLSQTISNFDTPSGMMTVSFSVRSQNSDGNHGLLARLQLEFNGVIYATIFNPTTNTPITVTYANGATGNLASFPQNTYRTLQVTFPVPAVASASLVFRHISGNDDWFVDNVFVNQCLDTDGDGIKNYLDLDSDNDGCPDAVEGGADVFETTLLASGGILQGGNGVNPTTPPTSGTFNQAVLLNICTTCSNTDGVPQISPLPTGYSNTDGQTTGAAYNAVISGCVCYNDAATGAGVETNHGITLLQRAGADNGNWPMIRKSAHTVLESNTKGFVVTRMTSDPAQTAAADHFNKITNPQDGMMVYDTFAKCLKIYTVDDTVPANSAWSCYTVATCPQ